MAVKGAWEVNNTYTLTVRPLFKGSKNPPEEVLLLLKTKQGTWGFGRMFKDSHGVYFNFHSNEQVWCGEPKSSFMLWALMPNNG